MGRIKLRGNSRKLGNFLSPEEEEKIKPDIARWESGDPVAAPARSTGWKVEEEEEEEEEEVEDGELSQALTDTGATCSSCSS